MWWWEICSKIGILLNDNIWIMHIDSFYEYIARNVRWSCNCIKENHSNIWRVEIGTQLEAKGSGPISYHLEADLFCDEEGALLHGCEEINWPPEKLICHNVWNQTKTDINSTLEKGDHPEFDTSEIFGNDDVKNINICLVFSKGQYELAVLTWS